MHSGIFIRKVDLPLFFICFTHEKRLKEWKPIFLLKILFRKKTTYLSYFAKKKFVNFRFSKSIQAAELAEPGYFDPASSYGIATGWGDTRSGGQISNVLLEVRVEIWSNTECSNQYEKIGDTILDTMLCAGSPGRDTCQVKIYVGQPIPIFRKTYSLIKFFSKKSPPFHELFSPILFFIFYQEDKKKIPLSRLRVTLEDHWTVQSQNSNLENLNTKFVESPLGSSFSVLNFGSCSI